LASKTLSIKVKVDLPTAGEIESKIKRSLNGLKDIKVDANVDLKVGKLGNLKRQLRNALGKENFKVNANVKVHGMAELNRVSNKLKEIRRLANEPIKLNVDMGGHDFDKSIEEARRKAEKINDSPLERNQRSAALVAAQKEMRAQQHAIERAQQEYLKTQTQIAKANDDRIKQNLQEYSNTIAQRQEQAEMAYAKAARKAGLSDNEISKNVLNSREQPKLRTQFHNAEIQAQLNREKEALRSYKRAVNEATQAQVSLAKGGHGSNVTAELTNQWKRATASANEYRRAIKNIGLAEQADRHAAMSESKVRMTQARAADGVYAKARRGRTGSPISPMMNVWDMLQTGGMAVAGVISGVNEVDKAITKVTKVVPDSQQAVNRWKKNIYRDAAEVGKTAPEFASAVEQWATAGYNLKQSNKLAKTSVMGAFVGEVPVNDMVRYMSVPMKAFQKEGLKSVDIVNAMNQVSNKHAIEMDDLGQAYQKASATMGATGTTFAQMTGIITAAQEGTRAGGDQIGTAFKTISANLAQVGSGITKQAQNKRDFFDSLGVQLKDSNGNLKSTYQIMDQLSKKWKTMSKQDKNTASLYAAGKNHANIFSATMDNWDTAKDAMREAEGQKGLGTSGSAYQEMAKQKQSIEFQLVGLKDAWMSFLQNLSGGREGIGQMLQIATGFGKAMDKLAENKLLSSTARWGLMATGAIMARKGIASLADGFRDLVSQGKKTDSLFERMTGLKQKNEAWKESRDKLRTAWAEFRGKESPNNKTEESIDALRNESPSKKPSKEITNAMDQLRNSTSNHADEVNKNTWAERKNSEAKRANAKAQAELNKNAKSYENEMTAQAPIIRDNTKGIKAHTGALGKLSKGLGAARAGLGVLGAGLGYVGIVMDTVAIAGAAMEAMGIHPIKMLKKVMDPAGESAKAFNKSISKTLAISEKLGEQGQKYGNQVENIKATNDAAKSLKDEINGIAASGAKTFDKDTLSQIKKDFNSLAEANGIKLKIDSDDVQQAQQRIQQLQDLIDMANDQKVSDLSDNIYKNIDQKKHPKEGQSWQDLLNSDKEYSKEDQKLRDKTRDDINRSFGKDYAKDRKILADTGDVTKTSLYKKRREAQNEPYRIGSKNARVWNSEGGRKALKASRNFNQNIRNDLESMAAGLKNGSITDDYIKNIASDKERKSMALSMANYLRGIRNSKDTQAISDGENKLKTILDSFGKGSQFESAKKAINGDTSAWTNWALKQGQAGEAILGVDAQYKSQYKDWKSALRTQAKQLSKYQGEAAKKQTDSANRAAKYFTDENGNVDIQKVDKLNASRANDKDGRKAVQAIGGKYKNGLLDMDSAIKMSGYVGGEDPIRLAEKIAKGNANLQETFAIGKGNGLSKSKIQQQIGKFGNGKGMNKKTFQQALDTAINNGAMSADEEKQWQDWYNKNYTKSGTAKTAKAALQAAEGKKQLTNKQLQDQLKSLSSDKERDQFIKGLKKNNQLSKDQWNKYKNADWSKLTPSKNKPKTGDPSAFMLGSMGWNNAGKAADWIDKQVKGLKKGINKNGILGDLGNKIKGGFKGLFNGKNWKNFGKGLNEKLFGKNGIQGTDLGKMFKGMKLPDFSKSFKGLKLPKLPDLSKSFKGLKMPKLPDLSKSFKNFKMPKMPDISKSFKGLNMKNPFKDWKLPKGLDNIGKNFKLPKGLTTNPFKNWKMPKGLDGLFKGGKKTDNPFKDIQKSWDKLFGKNGKNNKVKVDADTKDLDKKVKNLSKGKNKAKVKVEADTKGIEKNLKKFGKGKGQKIKLQADTKGISKDIAKLGKGKGQKIKLQADTKALTKDMDKLGKGKSKAKIKVDADTKSAESKIKSLSKSGKTKVKIKVDADTGSAKSKINSLKNSMKGNRAKIKVDADVSSAKSKINSIKSSLNGIKGSKHINISASGNASSFAAKVKSSLAGIHDKSISINASGNAIQTINQVKSGLSGIRDKSITITANDNATGPINRVKSARDSLKDKTFTVRADVGQAVGALNQVKGLLSSIEGTHTASVVVNKTVNTTEHTTKSKSLAITPENSQPISPMTSMSVVSNAINNAVANVGVDSNSAENGGQVSGIATTDRSDSTQKVSEDYWRYMGNELYTGLPLDEKVQNLENAVTKADDDMDKLITISKQRIDLDNKQIAYQKTMQGAYQQQINDVLNELHKYGFQTNGNQITNLNHAKDITGDNASKVDELLGKYQSAYQNFSEATKKIDELQTDIWQQGKNQQDYNNTKDQKMVEKLQRSLELTTTAIDNQKDLLEREGNSLEDSDYRMKLKNNSDQIYAKNDAVQQLLGKFNELSVANFVGTKDADNAKNLAESLKQIRDSIMENLDAIDELKKSIRDIQLNSIIESLSKYTDNLSNSIDRLKNNVTNLQDGLLSGTSYNDLMSSNFDVVNLNQKSAYEKSVADKIKLERELDNALDQFAVKNVDRTAQVANNQLQIEAQKYNEMLGMAINYARGARNEVGAIDVKYNVSVESDKIEVPDVTHNQEYVQSSIAYQKEMNELKAEYNRLMGEANTAEQKEAINSEMIYKQLELQEKVYNSMIEADKKAISDLREQAKNPDMTTEQLKTISDQIAEYEKNIIDAQNSIKDAVKNRFDYEKSLIDKQIDEYKRASDTIGTLVSIADTLHLEGSTQAAIINQQYASTYREYNNYLDLLQRLREELSKYDKGSYEYNQLSSMINEYQSSLDSTMSTLMDITKNEFGKTLDSIQKDFEKSVNKGMTADQAKFDQDVWYNPMQKELRLEEMRLKIVELEDKTVEKRIAALDAQERMSKAEADYVDKQLDLALAQQKLDNTINKKDVRYLEKDKDGKFNWTYIADQANVEEAQRAVNSAKQALEESKISNRNDYIQKVEEAISAIKDGSINQEELRSRLEQLNNSYKFILKDIPTFDVSKVEDIIKAYNDYEQKNSDILNDYKRSVKPEVTTSYESIVKGFGDQFKAVSKDLGEIFGKQLREALDLPTGIRNAYGNGNDKSLVVNGDIRLELPNVHNANEFAEAMKNLPQLAEQYATKKM